MGTHLDQDRRLLPARFTLAVTLLLVLLSPAFALVYLDFEQPYYVHPGQQVWDFCLIENEGLYNIFYHTIPLDNPYPSAAEDIWRATSSDLIHWSAPRVVLSVTNNWYESEAVWAPDVVLDPSTGLWFMAYTGVDQQQNQRICLAWSSDLINWGRVTGNPLIEPDPTLFHYDPDENWAICRDPYIYRADGLWHLLATAQAAGPSPYTGALLHTTSSNLMNWNDGDIFMVNDGITPDRVLESSTYFERDGSHHLFFHESGLHGVKHVFSSSLDTWTMANSNWIGIGIAPEIDTFDAGENYLISRLGQFQVHPDSSDIYFVAHFDTLLFTAGADHPTIYTPHPLAREFAAYSGLATWGNPCLGDNPARRGEPPVGLVGNSYFGSAEFFQGPLGYGTASGMLGDEAEARLESYPFVIEGRSMSLLIGGTENPDLCFVALMDAQADTVLLRTHATGNATMERRFWDLEPLQGIEAYILIVDADTLGHLNVDDIIESGQESPLSVPPVIAAPGLVDLGPRPNPFNPRAELRFSLRRAADFRARVHDLRGRMVWDSGTRPGHAGANSVVWEGRDRDGRRTPGGVYVYRIEAGGAAVSGKVTLLP